MKVRAALFLVMSLFSSWACLEVLQASWESTGPLECARCYEEVSCNGERPEWERFCFCWNRVLSGSGCRWTALRWSAGKAWLGGFTHAWVATLEWTHCAECGEMLATTTTWVKYWERPNWKAKWYEQSAWFQTDCGVGQNSGLTLICLYWDDCFCPICPWSASIFWTFKFKSVVLHPKWFFWEHKSQGLYPKFCLPIVKYPFFFYYNILTHR